MAIKTRTHYFTKALIGMFLLTLTVYGCNNSSSADEKKDTAAASSTAAPKDTTMKAPSDTSKTDTSGRGGQAPPTQH